MTNSADPDKLFTYLMANSADPDQLAYTVCKDGVYPGLAGSGLIIRANV